MNRPAPARIRKIGAGIVSASLLGIVTLLAFSGPAWAAAGPVPPFGDESTFDVMTWNLQWFPQSGMTTVNMVADIIEDLDLDLIALQEIESEFHFDALVDALDGWDGIRVGSAAYNVNLAYLYNTETVTVDRVYEVYTGDSYAFPRPPFIMELTWGGVRFTTVNLHLKCCDDGVDRRRDASQKLEDMLHSWVDQPGVQNIIVLGDLNDEIDDPPGSNVFQNLLNEADKFRFVTEEIVDVSGQESWPHPPHYSFLDHILITNDLFDEAELDTSRVETQRIDDYYSSYFDLISDHRPVAFALDINPGAPECTDWDEDGYAREGGVCGLADCNDNDPLTYPGAEETCDLKDNDCDGIPDDGPCLAVEAIIALAVTGCMNAGGAPQPTPEDDGGGGGGGGGCAHYGSPGSGTAAASAFITLLPVMFILLLKIRERR